MYRDNRFNFTTKLMDLAEKAEEDIRPIFDEIDKISEKNTYKVLTAFQECRVSAPMFAATTGYGYDDIGRETLEKIYSCVFHGQSALVRPGFVNGTHAISTALFSMLRPGDTLLSVTGEPYDTLQSVIGISGNYPGSLKYYNIGYRQVDLLFDGTPDYKRIKDEASKPDVKEITIQRSSGYSSRPALSVEIIGNICESIRSVNKSAAIIVDNCYGEFTEVLEPTDVGADIIAGSLIKNPGGGLAPTGGYLVGKSNIIEAASMRLTTPGIGGECGCTLEGSRMYYQGLFMAPHIVAQALKTAVFAARLLELMGYVSHPTFNAPRSDIIQSVSFGDSNLLEKFCRGIQAGSPVDSYVTPEAWDMPGYEDKVIMAAGTFVQGASIELSCDGPMREPYTAYLQGGLTYESGKFGILTAAQMLLEEKE